MNPVIRDAELSTQEDPDRVRLDLFYKIVFAVLSAILGVFSLRIIFESLHWPLVNDGADMAYLVFLMQHGMAPYRDIVETSFPGSYLLYMVERYIFGASALGFRLFDLLGLFVSFAAMMVIARRYWFAGLFASCFFLLSHTGGQASILDLGQRDFFMACLLLCCFAFAFEAVRREHAWLLFCAAFCFVASCTIKPLSLPFGFVLICALLQLRNAGRPSGRFIWATIAGIAVPGLIALAFLARAHAVGALLHIVLNLDPAYAGTGNSSLLAMLRMLLLPNFLFLQMLVAVVLAFALPRVRRSSSSTSSSSLWEQQILFGGVLCGAASFLIQHKSFHYQATPFLAFAYIWIALILVSGLESAKYRNLALATIGISALLFAPLMVTPIYRMDYIHQLHEDIAALGGAEKNQGSIQCLESTYGCPVVLYEMGVTHPTGFVGSFYFFLPGNHAIVGELRQQFMNQVSEKKPNIIVMSNNQWPGAQGYDQWQRWPAFDTYLNDNYHIYVERASYAGFRPGGYRLYVRNGAR